MENIYVQSEKARNAIVELPDGYAESAGNTLYSWLGSLWRGLHKGDGMIRGLQSARGFRMAQMYLDILESVHLQDRNGAPVFHRELWHPIVVRRSMRNKAQENMLVLGGDGRLIGPQPSGSVYGEGTVFAMGRMANYEDYVTYPVDASIAGGAATIVDNIVNPSVFLENGVDFEIRNGSIVLPLSSDPLGDESAFERYDLPAMIDEDGVETPDAEAVLWASDVLIDRDYIADHVSYALGASAPSTDVVKRILNAAWSAVASGLTPELIRTLMAAMLNVPVIQNETETVVDIVEERNEDGSLYATVVHTDAGSYRVSPKATLLGSVRSGAVLHRGDLLDETIRIYPYLNIKRNHDAGYSVPFEEDVPSVVLSSSILRASTAHGVYALWNEVAVKIDESRPYDANDNPRLYFDLGGSSDDVSAFWNDVWSHAEASGTSMEDLLGEEGSSISPAGFLIRNLVGANTLFIVIDRSQADDVSKMRDPMFFDMLSNVVPSAVRLFLIEHNAVGSEDVGDMDASGESEVLSAALPAVVDLVSADPNPAAEGLHPSYGERVDVRFVRVSPEKVRGNKED